MDTPEIRPRIDPVELHQMVRQRAFELYVERCQTHAKGSPEHDWQVALQEIAPYVELDLN